MKIELTDEELQMLSEIIESCQAYYEAIGDEDNQEVAWCNHLKEKFGLEKTVKCNNEIWW